MARRPRIHSRDLQPQVATPMGLLNAARVQRFDFPMNLPTTAIDELGRKLHVGTTTESPDVTVTMEAFDVSHNTFSMLTGYTPATFPVSGASITEFKNVDVIGQIRDATTLDILNAIVVKRGIVTGMDATFGVTANSTISYTVSSTSKKQFRQPVVYQSVTPSASGSTLSTAPTYLPRTSGYIIDAYRTTAAGSTAYLDEGIDFTVAGTAVTYTNSEAGNTIWFLYSVPTTTVTFGALDNQAPAAIQGKYVPLTISTSNIPRVQSATIRVAFNAEKILEMGGLGKPVGYEIGIPSVTGDVTVLKTDTDLVSLLTGQGSTAVEGDLEFAVNTLPLKIQLKDPTNPSRVILTYYVPNITITSHSDTDQVNQSMNETFGWESVTGELIVMSGEGVY